ncbi:MAG: glycoside hydrolase family 19 protein [Devosia sp.]
MINRNFFFETVRLRLFDGSLKAGQVAGLTGILDEWEAGHAKKDDRWLAYMLATVHHETDRTFRPIKEYGGENYFIKMYDVRGERPQNARDHGNDQPGDGPKYCGRGFVQLTWKNNYRAMSKVTGVDLVAHPERAMELPVATKILFYGMMNGSFTGKKLGDYFNPAGEDWVNARRIINGKDKANIIAEYGKRYYSAISYTTG